MYVNGKIVVDRAANLFVRSGHTGQQRTRQTGGKTMENFIASAASRETSEEVMEAIAFFARNEDEAVALWEGDGIGSVANLIDIWERATGNGEVSDDDLFWGGRDLSEIMAENE